MKTLYVMFSLEQSATLCCIKQRQECIKNKERWKKILQKEKKMLHETKPPKKKKNPCNKEPLLYLFYRNISNKNLVGYKISKKNEFKGRLLSLPACRLPDWCIWALEEGAIQCSIQFHNSFCKCPSLQIPG